MKMSPPWLPPWSVRIFTGGGGSVLAAAFVAAVAGVVAATAATRMTPSTLIPRLLLPIVAKLLTSSISINVNISIDLVGIYAGGRFARRVGGSRPSGGG
jgi:hypothetical protein